MPPMTFKAYITRVNIYLVPLGYMGDCLHIGGVMLTQQIMNWILRDRGLSTRPKRGEIRKIANVNIAAPINMIAAMAEGKEVILWHTSTGSEYIGYKLLANNDDGTDVAFGIPGFNPDPLKKLHGVSQFHFIECDGVIAPALDVWPMTAVYWLAFGDVGHYRVEVQLVRKDKDECKG